MEKGKVVIHVGESSWVKHLYREYISGVSIRVLAEYMQGTGVPYEEGKKWNINMIARILSDARYTGAGGYPIIIATDVFHTATEKKTKKAPAVQKTEAQKILRKKCGCRVTPHIEHEVLYLLNTLAGKPAWITMPPTPNKVNTELDVLQSELQGLMENLPVDEVKAREKLMELTVAMYEAKDPREYETRRLQTIFEREQPRTELDADLIETAISAVTMDSLGKVRIKLKNDQIIERRECGE